MTWSFRHVELLFMIGPNLGRSFGYRCQLRMLYETVAFKVPYSCLYTLDRYTIAELKD